MPVLLRVRGGGGGGGGGDLDARRTGNELLTPGLPPVFLFKRLGLTSSSRGSGLTKWRSVLQMNILNKKTSRK